MKAHLLFADRDFDFGRELPANHLDVVQDLELTTVFGAMAQGDRFLYDLAERVVLSSLEDPGDIVYRQAVLADCLANPDVVRRLYGIAGAALEDRRELWGYTSRYPTTILSGALNHLEAAVARLRELRSVADHQAGSFRSEGFRTLFGSLQSDLDDEYFELVGEQLRRLRFRDGKLLSAELDRDNTGYQFVLRSPGLRRAGWKERLGLGPHTSYSFTVPPRDEAGAQALSDLASRGVNLVANAAAQSADHLSSYFAMLRSELGFYVGCLNLHEDLSARGTAVAFPEPVGYDALALTATALRDSSLTLRASHEVVGIDVEADGKSLVMVTGANSGGKSTFLRSVGLAHMMMQSGMFVTAASFRASVVRRVFTHFVREEDATMTSGRLDEELERMSTIAEQLRARCLVLFNESFAATNEREGSEIARQVVRALVESGVRVVFVTHLYDLAESFYRQGSVSTLFLRAERRRVGTRDYHLAVAPPLPTSFGEDLYRRLGGWLGADGAEPGCPAVIELSEVSAHADVRAGIVRPDGGGLDGEGGRA